MPLHDTIRRRIGKSRRGGLEAGLAQLGAETFAPQIDPSDPLAALQQGPLRQGPVDPGSGAGGLANLGIAAERPGTASVEQGGVGRAQFGLTTGELSQPKRDFRKELSGVARESRIERDANIGKIPTAKEQARINLVFDERIKEATSPDQKQNLQRERDALRIGSTTPFLQERIRVRSSRNTIFSDAGVVDPANIVAIRKTNPRAFAEFGRVADALGRATEEDAPTFRREFENRKAEVTKIIASQAGELQRRLRRTEKFQDQASKLAGERGEQAKAAAKLRVEAAGARSAATRRSITKDARDVRIAEEKRIQDQLNAQDDFDQRERAMKAIGIRLKASLASAAKSQSRLRENKANSIAIAGYENQRKIATASIIDTQRNVAAAEDRRNEVIEQLTPLFVDGDIESGQLADADGIHDKTANATWTNADEAKRLQGALKGHASSVESLKTQLAAAKKAGTDIDETIFKTQHQGMTRDQWNIQETEKRAAANKDAVAKPADRKAADQPMTRERKIQLRDEWRKNNPRKNGETQAKWDARGAAALKAKFSKDAE